jgi:hypothetical protein
MKIKKKYILFTILILIFLLILSPRLDNPYPTHIDEWHHITESIKLDTQSPSGISAAKAGFHYILKFLDSFTNLILIYKFLPAIWAVIAALVLFQITKNQTKHLKHSFLIAITTIIFFASIKSNANIAGLWFFTPLTFSIPFIYLYIHLFNQGIKQQNKKLIIYSLAIMLILIPIHSISVLFSIPIIAIYLLFNLSYLKKEYKFFLSFLLIPILGILFYTQIMNQSVAAAIPDIISKLQFKHGFGVLEANNSPLELYSAIGYFLAILGIIYIITNKENLKKYLIYVIWPITLIVSILIFKQTGISYLSPYQRNLYYLAISLPFLSALGLYYLITKIKQTNISLQTKKLVIIITILAILFVTFQSYHYLPENMQLYENINKDNYEALQFLKTQPIQPNTKVIAPPLIATTIFPITNHQPLATTFFYGNSKILYQFLLSTDCNVKNEMIKEYNISYILYDQPINCSWEIIYNKNNNIIYKTG